MLAEWDYLALFPNIFVMSSAASPFTHSIYPVSVDKSRGVIRFYWVGDDENATQRFAREYSMAYSRDIHAEDRTVIEAGQRGLSTGVLTHIHFQSQEALCRHLFNMVDQMVQSYKEGRTDDQ